MSAAKGTPKWDPQYKPLFRVGCALFLSCWLISAVCFGTLAYFLAPRDALISSCIWSLLQGLSKVYSQADKMSLLLESSKEAKVHLWISGLFVFLGFVEYVLWQAYQPNDLFKLSWFGTTFICFVAYMAICPAISSLLTVPLGFFLRRHPRWRMSTHKKAA